MKVLELKETLTALMRGRMLARSSKVESVSEAVEEQNINDTKFKLDD